MHLHTRPTKIKLGAGNGPTKLTRPESNIFLPFSCSFARVYDSGLILVFIKSLLYHQRAVSLDTHIPNLKQIG